MTSLVTLALAATISAKSLLVGPVSVAADGFEFTEGPVWTADGELIFSDIPADRVVRLNKTVVFKAAGKTNGMTLDGNGHIIRCEGANRRVTRADGKNVMVLADSFQGKKLNSPNDCVWHPNGTVFFTDPTYGLENGVQEQPVHGAYAIYPDGRVSLVAGDFLQPNGIALSPGGDALYVADTEGNNIRWFRIAPGGEISGGEELCKVSKPDGIRVDTTGRVWATSDEGVVVFDATGKKLETIRVPQIPANCGFGGKDGKTLYITARTAVYKVTTRATGLVGGWQR